MARKRMIDPGIWESEQVQGLTPTQFKLYIYLISMADDEGRFKVNYRMMASKAMPLEDNYRAEECRADVEELYRDGLIMLYTDKDGSLYGAHPHWTRYQKINRPQPSHILSPEEGTPFTERSLNDHGTFTERSRSDHGTFTPNRIERNRKEENISVSADALDDDSLPAIVEPTKREVPPLKDEVSRLWESALTEMQPYDTWDNFGKQRKAAVRLGQRTRNLVSEFFSGMQAGEVIGEVLSEYRRMKASAKPSDTYWSRASYTPADVLTRWPQVWASLRARNEALADQEMYDEAVSGVDFS